MIDNIKSSDVDWQSLSSEEKKKELYLKQKAMLDMFLEHGAIASLCVAFAYLVSSFFGVTMFYTAPYLYIFLALGYYRPSDG